MANKIKLKRGLSSKVSSITLDEGEIAITTDTNKLYSKKGILNPDLKNLKIQKNNVTTTYDGKEEKTISVPTIHDGTTEPAASLGQNGDIYIMIDVG